MTHIERFLRWHLVDVLKNKSEYKCRICGETLFYRGDRNNDISMHFWNKHREIYLMAKKCDDGLNEYCDMLKMILKKYGKNKEVMKNEKL